MSELPFTSTAASGGGSEEVLGAFEHELAMGNTSAAVALVERALDAGAEPVSLLCEVIASAQHWVGQEWQTGRWSVAQEHIATGISLSATEAVARRVREVPITKGHVMVGCAEREWHALAALVVSTGLRAHGWRVTFLGAATPAEHLFSYLYQAGPDVVAISCSVAGGLPGMRRSIESVTQAGIPVLVGGSAFGVDELRARALGATAWAANLPEGIELVERLPTTVDPVEPLPLDVVSEQRALDAEHHRRAHRVLTRWKPLGGGAGDGPDVASGIELAQITSDCVEQALRTLEGALLTGDGRLVRETADWTYAVLASRSIPWSVVRSLRTELLAAVADLPRACRLLEQYWPDSTSASTTEDVDD